MRLTEKEIKTIKEIFKEKKVILFGSRVDNNVKGGDIDLFIDENLHLKDVIKYKVKLLEKLGVQKIDLVSRRYASKELLNEIRKKGIVL